MATLSTERVTYRYELMDAAYDAEEIGWHSYLSGHVPIIDVNTHWPSPLLCNCVQSALIPLCVDLLLNLCIRNRSTFFLDLPHVLGAPAQL